MNTLDYSQKFTKEVILEEFSMLKKIKNLGDLTPDDFFYIFRELEAYGYLLTGYLGSGQEGQVFEGKNVKSSEEVAIKIIKGSNADSVQSQISIISNLQGSLYIHQYITSFYSTNKLYFFVLTEKLNCDLESILEDLKTKNQKFSPNQVYTLALQMSTALTTLEQKNVLHSDLKPANILYDQKNRCFKITDYGLSKTILKKIQQSIAASSSIKGMTNFYAAPEAFNQEKKITCRFDVYSLGLLLLQLINTNLQILDIMSLQTGASTVSKFLKDEQYSKFKNILDQMLQIDVGKRISAKDLLSTLEKEKNNFTGEKSLLEFTFQNRFYSFKLLKIYELAYGKIPLYIACPCHENEIPKESKCLIPKFQQHDECFKSCLYITHDCTIECDCCYMSWQVKNHKFLCESTNLKKKTTKSKFLNSLSLLRQIIIDANEEQDLDILYTLKRNLINEKDW